ncbi:acetyl-CoA acetyltransferase [Bradyrhizobium sp. GM22.5]
MRDVFICDAVRTPIGRFGGSLAKVRADDLAAAPIKALMAKHPNLDWAQVDEVFFGCANQAGEDKTATWHAWRSCLRACRIPFQARP